MTFGLNLKLRLFGGLHPRILQFLIKQKFLWRFGKRLKRRSHTHYVYVQKVGNLNPIVNLIEPRDLVGLGRMLRVSFKNT